MFRAARWSTALALAWLSAPLTAQGPAAGAERQLDALRAIKTTRSAVQRKIDSRLFLGLLHQRTDSRVALLTDLRFVRNDADGRVAVDVFAAPGRTKPVLRTLESMAAVVASHDDTHGRIRARVPLADLEALAALPEVRKVRQQIPAMRSTVNVSEGDATHRALDARNAFGVNGAGVKVCVLADGVDSLASLQASGDLPAVDVLPGQAGFGDEGSAMLEIIHDLAPGAALGFATAFDSEASFAQNILDLAADGCDVLVDDVIYLDESPFQDGPVAQAVDTVSAAGVLYFSSAGNEGNTVDTTAGTWEGDFAPSAAADPTDLAGAELHDFGDGGNSILVELGNGFFTPPLLIWAEHYDLATGLASTDFDLYVMDGTLTTVFDASFDGQDGVGGDDFPIEFIGGGAFAGERLLVDLFAAGGTTSLPMFNLILFRGELDDALATGGATRGHRDAAGAISVAATPAGDSFDGSTPDGPFPGPYTAAGGFASESFAADGPRRILLGPTGVELTPGNRTSSGGVVRQKPDLSAADGVATAAPGFDPFYGSSASAPHAAAIAALVKQAFPAFTAAQVRAALEGSAIDIEAPGDDAVTGAGIVMAFETLSDNGATPQATLDDGPPVPSQSSGDGDAFIENHEIWNLTWPLTNVGAAPATAITAVLATATPGVAILTSTSTYPDLAAGGSGNNTTPFSLLITGAATCGGSIPLTLTVTYIGGSSPQVFSGALQIGSPAAPVTFTYSGPPVAIPDAADLSGSNPGAAVSASLPVAALAGNVYDVDLRIEGAPCSTTAGSTTVGIDHTFVADLVLTLRSPAGTDVVVILNTDGAGNNFCQTLLDDESAGASIQTVSSAAAPFTGSFSPAAPLSGFDGEGANGTWQLQAQDFFAIDTGNLRAFSLTLTPAVCDAPALSVDLTATKAVTGGTLMAGGTVVYTITLTNVGTGPQLDNPGDELTDTLPAQLAVGTPTASTGTVSGPGVNPVTWNGTIPAGASVTITVPATIALGTGGQTIANQATVAFDADVDLVNESSTLSDAPGGGPDEPTTFLVAPPIPTLSELALWLTGVLLAAAALWRLRAAG